MRLRTVLILGLCGLVLIGCTPSPTPEQQQPAPEETVSDNQAESLHAEDMQQREDNAAEADEVVVTHLLLKAANPVVYTSAMVDYYSGVQGYLAYPVDNVQAPAVILIHERWGLNNEIKSMADLLAEYGYTALAVDLYNGQVATDMSGARALSSALDQTGATANLLAAEEWLRTNQQSPQVVSWGRCLGGKQSLQLSLASDTLDGTIIYYGRLETDPAVLQTINTPVLGIFAENDQGIPPSQVETFEQALASINKQADITIYPGVDHAFANPTGDNYSPEATKDAREKTLTFLQTVFGQ